MLSMPKSAAFAALLLLFSPLSAAAEWHMAKPLKDLFSRRSAQAEEEKKQEAAEAAKPARFKDNNDGTLTDRRTGLLWLKNANCADFFEGDRSGGRNSRSWHEARVAVSRLGDGFCGLKDGSQAGDWRLPTREELLEISKDVSGEKKWEAGKALLDIQSFYYWSSSVGDLYPDYAFYVSLALGIDSYAFQLNSFHVLPVRRPKQPTKAQALPNSTKEETNAVRGLQNAAEEPVRQGGL
uniref:Lcl C-terminal domain-containing protein n=1 Tax=Candidatus Electronema sp. TaxID=2698783 RepID=UPI0040568480